MSYFLIFGVGVSYPTAKELKTLRASAGITNETVMGEIPIFTAGAGDQETFTTLKRVVSSIAETYASTSGLTVYIQKSLTEKSDLLAESLNGNNISTSLYGKSYVKTLMKTMSSSSSKKSRSKSRGRSRSKGRARDSGEPARKSKSRSARSRSRARLPDDEWKTLNEDYEIALEASEDEIPVPPEQVSSALLVKYIEKVFPDFFNNLDLDGDAPSYSTIRSYIADKPLIAGEEVKPKGGWTQRLKTVAMNHWSYLRRMHKGESSPSEEENDDRESRTRERSLSPEVKKSEKPAKKPAKKAPAVEDETTEEEEDVAPPPKSTSRVKTVSRPRK